MPMARALSTWACVPPIRSQTRPAMWPSPRCSRSMLAACQSRATGSWGMGRARSPAYMTRPSAGALVEQLGGAGEPGSPGEVAEDPPQRRHAALLTRGVRRLGCGRVPDLGDVAGHLTVGEVVEGRVDHLGRSPAERGRASREVAVPVVAEAERRHRVVGLRGEEVDQRDRLSELVETAGDWLGMLHLCHLLWSCRRPRGRPVISATNTPAAIRQCRSDGLVPVQPTLVLPGGAVEGPHVQPGCCLVCRAADRTPRARRAAP